MHKNQRYFRKIMPLITLTTDLGHQDAYVPILRATLLKVDLGLRIEDISHQVPKYDSFKAGDLLNQCFRYYPEGSLHLMAVGPEDFSLYPLAVIMAHGHYFAGTNNGMLSFISQKPDWCVIPEVPEPENISTSFPFAKVFHYVATHWKQGSLQQCGRSIKEITVKKFLESYITGNQLVGYVSHIDHFGNAITNIRVEQFNEMRQGREYLIEFRSYETDYINSHYSEVPSGEQAIFFNSQGFLEIAQNKGNAEKLMGLKRNDKISINFE